MDTSYNVTPFLIFKLIIASYPVVVGRVVLSKDGSNGVTNPLLIITLIILFLIEGMMLPYFSAESKIKYIYATILPCYILYVSLPRQEIIRYFKMFAKALAIIGLVLQLAGAGGLMPVQMLSAPLFQEIYPWLPFAHSMPALEGAMAGIYGDQYLVQMGLLAAILAPSLVLGLVLRRPVIRLNDWVLAKLDETKFL